MSYLYSVNENATLVNFENIYNKLIEGIAQTATKSITFNPNLWIITKLDGSKIIPNWNICYTDTSDYYHDNDGIHLKGKITQQVILEQDLTDKLISNHYYAFYIEIKTQHNLKLNLYSKNNSFINVQDTTQTYNYSIDITPDNQKYWLFVKAADVQNLGEIKLQLLSTENEIDLSDSDEIIVSIFGGFFGYINAIPIDTIEDITYYMLKTYIRYNTSGDFWELSEDGENYYKIIIDNSYFIKKVINTFDNDIAPEIVLGKIKTVDGSGSDLDADYLDGLDSTQFVRRDIDQIMKANYEITENLTIDKNLDVKQDTTIEGNLIINGNSHLIGDSTYEGNLLVKGNEEIQGTLTVTKISEFKNNVTIDGNLDVKGTLTSIESKQTTIEDNIITLNKGETGSDVTLGTAGFEIDRGTSEKALWIFDEFDDSFKGKIGDNLLQLKVPLTPNSDNSATSKKYIVDYFNNSISGTVGYISKFNDNHTIRDSIIYEKDGNIGISTTSPSVKLEVSGNIKGQQLISTISEGTSPLIVSSKTKVDNLNADLLDGLDSTQFVRRDIDQILNANYEITGNLTIDKDLDIKQDTTIEGNLTVNLDTILTENVNIGKNLIVSETFTVSKTSEFKDDVLFDKNIEVKNQIKSDITTVAPFVVASTIKVDNLNADLLDGHDSTYFAVKSEVNNENQTINNKIDALDLQTIYNQTQSDTTGAAAITLTTGKSLRVYDDDNNTIYFEIDANTGKVTITGDLNVSGTTTTVNSTITDEDHLLLSPASASTIALQIKPDSGVTLSSDAINVAITGDGNPIFRVASDGYTYIDKIKIANQGSGSNIDADLLDGLDSSQFLRSDIDNTANGIITFTKDIHVNGQEIYLGDIWIRRYNNDESIGIGKNSSGIGTYVGSLSVGYNYDTPLNSSGIIVNGSVGIGITSPSEKLDVDGNIKSKQYISTIANGTSPLIVTSSTKVDNLNADLLDGYDSTYFANTTLSNVTDSIILNKLKNVDGSGSGLDADLLDGLDSSQFLRKDTNNTYEHIFQFIGNGDVLKFKAASSGGNSGIRFDSNVNYGSDYAEIVYYDDNNNYNKWGDSNENSALVIRIQNDPQNSVSDVIALESPAAVFLNAPATYFGDKNSNTRVQGGKFYGTATSAEYADLAEKYKIKGNPKPGDVIKISFDPNYEGEICNEIASEKILGVISENPAYLMRADLKEGIPIALKGRIKCKVIGKINKGDILISYKNGCATSIDYIEKNHPDILNSPFVSKIGNALENYNNEKIEGIIWILKL